MDRQVARANPMLELAATRLRLAGDGPNARRMEILRVEGLAESGATPVPDLIDRLAQVKDEARMGEDWEALALALDVELHLRYTEGDVPRVRALLDEMAPDDKAAVNVSRIEAAAMIQGEDFTKAQLQLNSLDLAVMEAELFTAQIDGRSTASINMQIGLKRREVAVWAGDPEKIAELEAELEAEREAT